MFFFFKHFQLDCQFSMFSGINATIFRLHVHSLLDLWFADWLHRPAATSKTMIILKPGFSIVFHSSLMDTPIYKWMMKMGGTPILGNHQIVPQVPRHLLFR